MNEKALLSPLHLCLLIFSHMLSTMLYECSKREQRSATKNKIKSGKIPINGLTDVILALLHAVAAPCHCHRGRHGGRCHRRLVLTPAPPHQPPPSAALHHHVLERPRPLPLTGRLTSRWSPRTRTPLQEVSRGGRQGEEGREEEDDERRVTVVTNAIGTSMIHRMARITIGPRGRPHGPLAPRTEPSPSSSPTSLTLAAPPPPVLPSPEASLSGFGMLPDLLSPCGNHVLWWFARFASPSGKGHAPGS
jgi:hypothetical protein